MLIMYLKDKRIYDAKMTNYIIFVHAVGFYKKIVQI